MDLKDLPTFIVNFGALGILAFWMWLQDRRLIKVEEQHATTESLRENAWHTLLLDIREDGARTERVVASNTEAMRGLCIAVARLEISNHG